MRTLLFFLLLANFSDCCSQQYYELKRDTLKYYIGDTLIDYETITIENLDDDDIWIWFSRDSLRRDERQEIKRYLFTHRGDFSIYDLVAGEPSVDRDPQTPLVSKVYDMFLKRLRHKEKFVIIDMGCDVQSIENSLRIYSYAAMNKYVPEFMEEKDGLKWLCYPYNSILFPKNRCQNK